MRLLERELLDALAHDRDDRAVRSVLADYWIECGLEARGTFLQLCCGDHDALFTLGGEVASMAHCAAAWRAPLVGAGFAERDLVFDGGILEWPLAVDAGEPLDDHPALVRVSP